MSSMTLLRMLSDGDFHSGEVLAHSLGLGRGAIWKQVRALRDLGISVDAVRGRGYRIPGGVDLLDKERILRSIPDRVKPDSIDLDIFESVDSTNAVAFSRLRAGDRTSYACLAERQTAGRGRRGRNWVSPFAANIYLSVVHEFTGGFSSIDGLSLAVGVSVCEALEALGVDDVRLKWPNDLVWHGAKIGGILIEIAGDVGGACQAVIGVGMNVSMPHGQVDAIGQAWADLCRAGLGRGRRNDVAAALLEHIIDCVREFDREGFAGFLPRWERFDALIGREVDVVLGEQSISGTVERVDLSGALVLRVSGTLRQFRSGEVSVRNWQ